MGACKAGGGSFGATEESTATEVLRAKLRESCTEDQCGPALTNLSGWEWSLRLQWSDPRERTGVGCVNTA